MPVPRSEDEESARAEAGLEEAVRGHDHRPLADRGLDYPVVSPRADGGCTKLLRERPGAGGSRGRPLHEPVQLPKAGERDDDSGAGHETVDLGFQREAGADREEECVRVEQDNTTVRREHPITLVG